MDDLQFCRPPDTEKHAPKGDSSALHDAEWILSHNCFRVHAVLVYDPLCLDGRQPMLLQEQHALPCACVRQLLLGQTAFRLTAQLDHQTQALGIYLCQHPSSALFWRLSAFQSWRSPSMQTQHLGR